MGGSFSVPGEVLRLVREQCGVVRREQLYAAGMSRRTLARRVNHGLWEPRGRDVLVFAGTAPCLLTDSLVAAQALAPRAVLTGYSALAALGVAGDDPWSAIPAPDVPWVRSPHATRLQALVLRDPPARGRTLLGVAVSTREQVLEDLARHLPEDQARTLMFRVAQLHGAASLQATLASGLESGAGRRGARQLRALVGELGSGAESDAEQLLVRLLVEAGFTGFVVNHPVRIGGRLLRIDVAFPVARLAIEVDGQAFHTSGARFQGDRTRQNGLVASGWQVLRFTWDDLTQRPDLVLRQIAAMLGH